MTRAFAKRSALIVALLVFTMVAAACGGGGTTTTTSSGTPEEAVKAFFDAAFAGNTDAAKAAVCADGQATVDQMISGLTAASAGGAVDASGLTYTKASESGDDAVVNIGGNLRVTVAGTTTDVPYGDGTLAVPVKRESGAWKVCGF